MRLDWLEDVIALLDTGGVAEAAKARNITQPAFSRRMRALEDVLGIAIVDRTARPSGPTEAVRDHSDRLRRLADEQRALMAAIRQAQATGAPQLVLVCQHAITTSLGPRIVANLRDSKINSVRLRSANRSECEAVLFAGGAALSLTYQMESEPTRATPALLKREVLGSDQLVAVAGANHAKSQMWQMHQGRLQIIGYPSDVFLGAVFSRHIAPGLTQQGELSVAAETALTPAALQMARAGIGIAWVPLALAGEGIEDGSLINLSDELGSAEMQIVAHGWAESDSLMIRQAWLKLAHLMKAAS
ncbi:LysR family transcriptional regulator [Pontivivens insulae]|nr:LysR family transcriptional regulator [Pontivivens insulae]